VDDAELGMEKLGAGALMATLDEVKPHLVALKSRVILESPRAVMSSQYLCGTTRPDTAHIVHEVEVRDAHGEMQRVRALIDCGATSIFMAPRLRRRLGIRDEPALTATVGLDGRVMVEAKDSWKATISVRYLDQLAPVDEPEVLIVPMRACDLVLGMLWLTARNPEIDWSNGRLTALRTPNGKLQARDPRDEAVRDPRDGEKSEIPMADPTRTSPGRGHAPPNIELLGATAFVDLLASDEVDQAFALRIGDCTGLLGATLGGTSGEKILRSAGSDEQGAEAVVAAEELHIDGA